MIMVIIDVVVLIVVILLLIIVSGVTYGVSKYVAKEKFRSILGSNDYQTNLISA